MSHHQVCVNPDRFTCHLVSKYLILLVTTVFSKVFSKYLVRFFLTASESQMSNNCQVQSKVMSGIFKFNIHVPNVHSKTNRFIIRPKSHKKKNVFELHINLLYVDCQFYSMHFHFPATFKRYAQARRRSKTYLQGSSTFNGNANPVCAGLSMQTEASQHT